MVNAFFGVQIYTFSLSSKKKTTFFYHFFLFLGDYGLFLPPIKAQKAFLCVKMDAIAEILIDWYDTHHRELPWRETRDPYAVWISEIILQQTRVAQGYDYYVRFLRTFPTVEALAAADEDRVLRLWQGLGYYSRARNLHAAARQIVAQGGFPTTYEGLLRLRGVGEYTAAAIGSFAYGIPLAVVDGNVYRVLSRLFAATEPIDTTSGKKLFAQLATQLLPGEASAHYNQAIMEFGALQCVPHSPRCDVCPLVGKCLALARGMVDELPVKSHRTKVTERWFHYFYVHNATHMYLHHRTANDIWRGLYELPLLETPGNLNDLKVPKDLNDLKDLNSLTPAFRFCATRRHVLSHQVIHATLYEAEVQGELPPSPLYNTIRIDDLDDYALPRLVTLLLGDRE